MCIFCTLKMATESAIKCKDHRELDFSNKVASACFKKYLSLPKTGKPKSESEWTLLSAVVKVRGCFEDSVEQLEVVALGTGSKCIGQCEMSSTGDILNDSHAEVIARRSFLRYLYYQVDKFFKTGSSDIFIDMNGKCIVKEDISFHFYTSQVPCGDASIFPKDTVLEEDYGDILQTTVSQESDVLCKVGIEESNLIPNSCHLDASNSGGENLPSCREWETSSNYKSAVEGGANVLSRSSCKRKSQTEHVISSKTMENPFKQQKLSVLKCDETISSRVFCEAALHATLGHNVPDPAVTCGPEVKDIHRTGAKCLSSEPQDAREPGVNYHVIGVLRTKPGRGDPTLSLSCSDKLARWNAVGCQGALLSLLIKPIRFHSVIVGGGVPFSNDALTRAIIGRVASCCGSTVPLILRSSVPFPDGKPADGSKQPCPSSIVWCQVENRPFEVAVKGRKQGVTKKLVGTATGRLQICRRELALQFVAIISQRSLSVCGLEGMDSKECLGRMSYRDLKSLATEYQQTWRRVREQCFPSWPMKPQSLTEFTLNS